MMNDALKEQNYAEEIVRIIRSSDSDDVIREELSNYHDNDIAQSLELLTKSEKLRLFNLLDAEWASEILSYVDNPAEHIEEIGIDCIAELVNEMDSDDAVDFLESLRPDVKNEIYARLDADVKEDIRLINSYDKDEIGSLMTTNYICINSNYTIRQAMRALVEQAGDNDNIATIYVADDNGIFCGAVELKDLIIARAVDNLEDIVSHSYPYLSDHDKITENFEKIKNYAEDSLPVLNERKEIIGVLTAQDVIELVDDEMGEDYAKLGGLSAEEDLNESTAGSVKKRLPWLMVLLLLGMGVSTVVGMFELVVATLPIVICFQSLILDMAGNVGTQSLAVTIRVLMDEKISAKDKLRMVSKELRVGVHNGLILGSLALLCLGVYIFLFKGYDLKHAFLISSCVGVAMLLSIIISSLVGTLVPMFFNKIKVDPAAASGPLITTVNDLVAVVTYYGIAWIFLIQIMHIA